MAQSEKRKPKSETSGVSGDLERGRACYATRQWADAFEAFSRADVAQPLGVEDLELLAWSAALSARDEALLSALERLYHIFLEANDPKRAVRPAFWLSLRLSALGEMGRAGGWLARAQRLVEEAEEGIERGYLLLPVAQHALGSGDYEGAVGGAAKAARIGEQCDEPDLVAFARNLQGQALIRQGRVQEGLGLLDEAMVSTTGGELSPIITGIIYCTVIATCQKIYALNRCREWTEALSRWCDSQPQLTTFTGSCLVHRAEVMQLGGEWQEAMTEARRAAERFEHAPHPEAVGDAYYQQAEIQRLRGELDAAEKSYQNASRFGRDPQPGLALLRLRQGSREAARKAIQRLLDSSADRLKRASLLPAFIEIMLAVGAVDEADKASQELEQIAEAYGTDVLRAMSAHARGAVGLARGDARAALAPLREAFDVWQQVGAPYIAARIRVLLARACSALGDGDSARLELDAARQVFERLGAAPDLAALDASRPEKSTEQRHGLTPRELEVLRLVASGKTNKAIANQLFLSERTIDRHVSNIFTKLDVSSRASATAFAYEHQLL